MPQPPPPDAPRPAVAADFEPFALPCRGGPEAVELEVPLVTWRQMDQTSQAGLLLLTEYRLAVMHKVGPAAAGADQPHRPFSTAIGAVRLCSIPLSCVRTVTAGTERVESLGDVADGGLDTLVPMLEISCKDARRVRLIFDGGAMAGAAGGAGKYDGEQAAATQKCVHEKLLALVSAQTDGLEPIIFAHSYGQCVSYECNGWALYDPVQEYGRQGVVEQGSHPWKLHRGQSSWQKQSPTYPPVVAVPRQASDEMLAAVCAHRSKARIPILCYFHQASGASITRCSQPLTGVLGALSSVNNSDADADFLALIGAAGHGQMSRKLLIADARPKLNAEMNRFKGGGYEDVTHYALRRQAIAGASATAAAGDADGGSMYTTAPAAGDLAVELKFYDIENIHKIRESFHTLHDSVCSAAVAGQSGRDLLPEPRDCSWCRHLHKILLSVRDMVLEVSSGSASVVVHCSDGWDRTSQMSALAMICLDPYYRTLRGFEVLVEQEWLAVGHKFKDRTWNKNTEDEHSPIFVQFLDSVHQLMRQFPDQFEYSEWLLITLSDLLYCNLFGNFLHNTQASRDAARLSETTTSIWSYVGDMDQRHPGLFRNQLYCREPAGGAAVSQLQGMGVLLPQAGFDYVTVWQNYFLRWFTDPLAGYPPAMKAEAADLAARMVPAGGGGQESTVPAAAELPAAASKGLAACDGAEPAPEPGQSVSLVSSSMDDIAPTEPGEPVNI